MNIFQKFRIFIKTHKKTSIVLGIVLVLLVYFIYKKASTTNGETTYVLGTVERGTVVSSITGSGQVSTDHTLDLKPQASGTITYVGVKAGQKVAAGTLIARLDTTQAQKSVRDAEANLASAKLSMQKQQEPASAVSILSAKNALTQANQDLAKAYSDGSTSVSNTFLDLPSIVSGIDGILHHSDASANNSGQPNVAFYSDTAKQFETGTNVGKATAYATEAEEKFQAVTAAYDKNFADFKAASGSSDPNVIEQSITETYNTVVLVRDALQSSSDLIQHYQNMITRAGFTPSAKSTTALSTLSVYISQNNAHLSSLSSAKNTIVNDKVSVPEKQASLDELQAGPDTLDTQSSALSVTKAQNALQDAKDTLQNYYVYAPFAGTIATVGAKVGDPASSASAVATLIADQDVVNLPLNEVDVAKVKIGNKATLTFDAIDNLTLTGKVTSIDTVGTVSQGVVNYTVTVAFDSADDRVLPGMSTTASIITQVHPDVLTVPSSAIKTGNGGSYVLAFVPALTNTTPATGAAGVVSSTAPEQISVTTGISDDTNTEIVSGLTEGQQIVTRSIAATTAKTTTAPSLLGGGGARGATGGSAFRGTTAGR